MNSLTRALDPAELLAEAGWVRGIVRKLVLDEASAEDVAQDTWLAALERRAPGAERGGLRAWLTAVAKNLARRRARRETLRAAVERAAARAERVEGASGLEELERMQLQGALVEAVLALEEPYRSAVVLRHLDGISAAEIARRQGCTSALARQRVSRGLAQLRERLAHLRGRHAEGCLALAPLLGARASGLLGGTIVSAKTSLGIAGGVLLVLALVLTRNGRDERGDGKTRESEPRAVLVSTGAGGAEEPNDAEGPSRAAMQGTAVDTNARVEAEEPERATRRGSAELRGRITDTAGRPLAHAALALARPAPKLALTSGDDGGVAGKLPPELLGALQPMLAACDGYLPRTLELDLAVPFTLALQRLPALAGRVRAPAGRELALPGYAEAVLLDAATHERRTEKADLATDGSYRLEGLPLGRLVSLEARARGFATTTLTLDRALEPDSTTELDVELAPGAVVTGTVLDARTRAPVPGAEVWVETFGPEEDSVHPTTTADDDGRFWLEGVDESLSTDDGRRSASFWLQATAPGYTNTPTRGYGSAAHADHTYAFEILIEPAGASLRLRLHFANGKPASGAKVWAIDSQGKARTEFADGQGEKELSGLPAGTVGLWLECREHRLLGTGAGGQLTSGTFRIRLNGGGLQLVSPGPLHALRSELELAPGEARTEDLVLRPPGNASLTGRVIDVTGRGVADFVVRCHLNFQLNGTALAGEWDELRTGADGSYRIENLHGGKYEVWTNGEGTAFPCAIPEHTYVDLEEDQEGRVEDLVVGPCFTLEGRIEPGDHDLAVLEVTARNADGSVRVSTRPNADGSFRFDPLVEQEYELALMLGDERLDHMTASPRSSAGLFLRAR